MADITMCNHDKCEKKNECYRYSAVPNEYRQTYLAKPKSACVNNDYKLFWEITHKKI